MSGALLIVFFLGNDWKEVQREVSLHSKSQMASCFFLENLQYTKQVRTALLNEMRNCYSADLTAN